MPAGPGSMRAHGTGQQGITFSDLSATPGQASLPALPSAHPTGCHTVTSTRKLLQAANREATGWAQSRRQRTGDLTLGEDSGQHGDRATQRGDSGAGHRAATRRRQKRPASASASAFASRARTRAALSARSHAHADVHAASHTARAARAARCLGTDSILALSASLDMRRRVRIEVQHIARQATSASPRRKRGGLRRDASACVSSASRSASRHSVSLPQARAQGKLSAHDRTTVGGGGDGGGGGGDGGGGGSGGGDGGSNEDDTFAIGGLWEQHLGFGAADEDAEMAKATEFMALVFGVGDSQLLRESQTGDVSGSGEEESVAFDDAGGSASVVRGDESVMTTQRPALAQHQAHASSTRAGVSKLFRITGGACQSPIRSATDPRRIAVTSGIIPESLRIVSPSTSRPTSPTTSPSTSPYIACRSLRQHHHSQHDVNRDHRQNESRSADHHKDKDHTIALAASRGFAASTFVGGRGLNLGHTVTASVDDRVEKLLESMCERVELAPGTIFELFEQARRRQSSVLSGTGWRAAHSAVVPTRAPEQSEIVQGSKAGTTGVAEEQDVGGLQNFDARMSLAAQRCAALRDQAVAALDSLDRTEALREARLEERAQSWSRAQARQRARKMAQLTAQAQAAMRQQRGEPEATPAVPSSPPPAMEGTLPVVDNTQSTLGDDTASQFGDSTVDAERVEHQDRASAARLCARRAQLRRRIAALQRLGCHINKERTDNAAHLRCQAVAASADAPARKLLVDPGNMASLEAQWRLSGRLGIEPCTIAAEAHAAALGAAGSRSKVATRVGEPGAQFAARRLRAARAWRWALRAAIPLVAVRLQWKLAALRARQRAQAQLLPRSPSTKLAAPEVRETKAQYQARMSRLMADNGIPSSVAMRLHLKVAIARKRKAAAVLRDALQEWETSGTAVRVRRRRIYMWKQLLRVSDLTRRLQALARGMHSCVNARVEVLLRMWTQYEDEHAHHKSQARRREARSGMAGRLDEETQLANARCFDFDRKIQELLGSGGRIRAHAEAKERVAEELKRELLRHYVVLQRKYCMERKKIALDERTRPVSAVDVQGFLRDTRGDGHAKLSQIAFTSVEELTRSAAAASRTRMVLTCDARDRRSAPNRRNLQGLSKWCARKSNLANLQGIAASERRALLQKVVLEVVNPACMCTYCAQHNQSLYNAAREKDGDLRHGSKGSWRSGSPATYLDTGASSTSNQSFYSYGGSSTGFFSPLPSRSSTRAPMYK